MMHIYTCKNMFGTVIYGNMILKLFSLIQHSSEISDSDQFFMYTVEKLVWLVMSDS